MPKLKITLSAIQPAVRGVTLSASGGDAMPLVLWLSTERADFKSQRSSTMLTHAACTIDGRKGPWFSSRALEIYHCDVMTDGTSCGADVRSGSRLYKNADV